MSIRRYYSVRTGKNPNPSKHDLTILKRLFRALYDDLYLNERLQEFLGKDCPDDQDSYGTAGRDVAAFFLRKLRKDGLWPINTQLDSYSEEDLFDVIELLYDNVSVGTEGHHHNFGGCGMHYSKFSAEKAKIEFRQHINELLLEYEDGFELSKSGEILHLPAVGFEHLVGANIPHVDERNVAARIASAVDKYRSRSSGLQDRKDATRALIDVLEFLRPQLKQVFATKDEADLFNIANNFGLRHHNDKQRTDYDPNIWNSWMFYFYLATVHAALRMLERREAGPAA